MSALDIVSAKLLADTDVTSIVGSRIRPISQEQGDEPPLVFFNLVYSTDTVTLQGAGKYYKSRVQVDCIASSPSAVMTLGDVVLEALDDTIKETVGAFKDVDILFAGVDFTDRADNLSVCRRVLQFRVHWRRA